jgi:hypothetical protein
VEAFLELEPIGLTPGVHNPSLGPEELRWFSRLSGRVVGPLLDRLGPERAAPLYLAYAFKVLARPQAARAARVLSGVLGGSADLSLPDGYLDPFRGTATCLRDSALHRPYLHEYLEETTSAAGDASREETGS